MEFFANSCKRYCWRTASPVEADNDEVRQQTATQQQHQTVSSSTACSRISLCCATAMLYCYAARGRRENRSSRTGKTTGQSASSTGALDDVITADIGKLELPRLHHSASPKSRNPTPTGTRGSILKNSLSSSTETPTGGSNSPLAANATSHTTAGSRTTADSGFDGDGSIPDIRRSASPEKRASFNEAVDVIVADDHGRQVVADSIRLKSSSADDDHRCVDETSASSKTRRKTRGCDDSSSTTATLMTSGFSGGGRKYGTGGRLRHPTYVYPPASRCRHAFSLASADVERRPDGSRYLRAVIRPATSGGLDTGSGIGRTTVERENDETQRLRRLQQQQQRGVCGVGSGSERVVVRAGAKGSRLVVGAYRAEPLGDGTNYLKQYIDRFPLPRAIETQTIRADMQPTGVLVITAAINESSDTDTE